MTTTNTSETADDAARRFAGEVWRLASGLADRGIPLVENAPIDTAPVDTVLATIDQLTYDRHTGVLVNSADLRTVLNQREASHAHQRPGIWDDSNRPEIAGKPCVECAARQRLHAALDECVRIMPIYDDTALPDWAASHDTTLSGTARGILEYMLDEGAEDGTTLHELAEIASDPVGEIGRAIKELLAAGLIVNAGTFGITRRTLWKPTDKAREEIS